MNIEELIALQLAKPITHFVVTKYEDGTEKRHDVRSAAAAENWAIGERRKIGRNLISRETGNVVRVVSVTIERII